MKKVLLILALVLCFASVSFGYQLLAATATTGAGSAVILPELSHRHTCAVVWGGTAPTNTVIAIEGSIDGVTYGALYTPTITATGTVFHIADKPVFYIRGNYVSKSGGDETTTVQINCASK